MNKEIEKGEGNPKEEEQPHNRAGFNKDDSIEEKKRKHNKNVKETMKKAKEGKTVNLSDMMMDREEIHIQKVEGRK